jgi:rhodanese-related sulfurtransferase
MQDSPMEINAADALAAHAAGGLMVDVREAYETALAVVPGSTVAPLSAGVDAVVARVMALEQPACGVVVCAAGVRSLVVVRALHAAGASNWRSLTGGIGSWHRAGGALEVPGATR